MSNQKLTKREKELIEQYGPGDPPEPGYLFFSHYDPYAYLPQELREDPNLRDDLANARAKYWTSKRGLIHAEVDRQDSASHDRGQGIASVDHGGAPRKYTWEAVADELTCRVGKQGIPSTKAELIRWVQEFLALPNGDQPDDAGVRKYLQKCFPKLYQAAGKNAGNA